MRINNYEFTLQRRLDLLFNVTCDTKVIYPGDLGSGEPARMPEGAMRPGGTGFFRGAREKTEILRLEV